jgi:hypothetical protein
MIMYYEMAIECRQYFTSAETGKEILLVTSSLQKKSAVCCMDAES